MFGDFQPFYHIEIWFIIPFYHKYAWQVPAIKALFKAPRVRAMQVPPIPNQRSDAVCSSTLNRKALGGNRLNAHSRLLAGRKMTCDSCDCDFLGTGGRGLVTTPSRVGEIFANPSEKYAQVKLDHFSQSSEWIFSKKMKPPPNPIFGKRLGVPQPNLLRNSSFIIRSSLASMGYRLNFHEFAKKVEFLGGSQNPKAKILNAVSFVRNIGVLETAEFLITKIPCSTT